MIEGPSANSLALRAIGHEMRAARTGDGITLDGCARLLGWSMAKLSKAERGKHALSVADMVGWVEAMKQPIQLRFGGIRFSNNETYRGDRGA